MANRYSWKDLKSDYNAGQAAAMAASRMLYDRNADAIVNPLTKALEKNSLFNDQNVQSKSDATTADIIAQIRAGKTPEKNGYYNNQKIADAQYEYDKYQTAQAFKRRAEARSIAAAKRAASGRKSGSGTAGAPMDSYTPYGTTTEEAKSALTGRMPSLMGDVAPDIFPASENSGYYAQATPPDMSVLDEMTAPAGTQPFAGKDNLSEAIWRSQNPNPGTSKAPATGNSDFANIDNYLTSKDGMEIFTNANESGGSLPAIPTDSQVAQIDAWKAAQDTQARDAEFRAQNPSLPQGNYTPTPETNRRLWEMDKQAAIDNFNGVQPIDPNAENAAIQADLLRKKVAEQQAIANAAKVKAGSRLPRGDSPIAPPSTPKEIAKSMIQDKPGDDISRKILDASNAKAAADEKAMMAEKAKQEASSLQAFKDARTKDREALAVNDAQTQKRVAQEEAAAKQAEADKTIKKEAEAKAKKQEDASAKKLGAEVSKYTENNPVGSKKTTSKKASPKKPEKPSMTQSEKALKANAETVKKATKTRDDIVKPARREKAKIRKWARTERQKAMAMPRNTRAQKAAYKSKMTGINADEKRLLKEQSDTISNAKDDYTSATTIPSALSKQEQRVYDEKKASQKEAIAPKKQKLKDAQATIAAIKSKRQKTAADYTDYKSRMKKDYPSLSDKEIRQRYYKEGADGRPYKAPAKQTKKDAKAKYGKAKTDAVLSTLGKLTGVKPSKLDAARGSNGSYEKLNTLVNIINSKYPNAKSSDIAAFMQSDTSEGAFDASDNWMPWSDNSSAINYKVEYLSELFDKYAKNNNLKATGTPSKKVKKIIDKNGSALERVLKDGR